MKVGFISLGCSKNLVDTEMMIGLWKENGYEIVANAEEADIIVINTCGFIQSAKEEAINTILEMAEYKENGKCKYLIATGCLVKRYKEELQKEIPEVDLWISIEEYPEFWEKVQKMIKKSKSSKNTLDYHNRIITTGAKTAYLKIAEGCSNFCTYCAIPKIRGPFESRTKEDILTEAKELAQKGIEEIIVIAQDTTKYGIDIYGSPKLAELLHELSQIQEFKWIRFLYAYPESVTDELIKEVKNNPKICKYFDIPIQHISDDILKRMNRKSRKKEINDLLNKIKKEIPNVVLRTSLIVGFPTETEENFEELYKFVEETKFDKLGVFEYSKEDGTPAEKMKGQIAKAVKKKRWSKIMKLQQEISHQKMLEKIGKEYEVLVENITSDGKYFIGRTCMDVPDMDGVVYMPYKKGIELNQFVNCKITDVRDYDMIGEIR